MFDRPTGLESEMLAKKDEVINVALRDHQSDVQDWDFSALAADLHRWAERMVVEFKLDIGTPALMFERLRGRLGHYRRGRNAFGLKDEVAIDEDHARASPYWQVIGTVLHELLHSWQEHSGRPPSRSCYNYHNRQFREKARELGLIVDRRGHTQYVPCETPFLGLLSKYGVAVPDIPQPVFLPERRGKSKLNLYECPCGVKVRVGRSRFNAKCLDCCGNFERMG